MRFRAWDAKFPSIGLMWRRHWPNLIAIFDYPPEIRKVIYTTNAIESLNSVIRKSVRKRKLFPSDTAALKVVYLSAMEASKRWKRPVRDWKNALNQFAIQYDGELNLQSCSGAYTVSCTDSYGSLLPRTHIHLFFRNCIQPTNKGDGSDRSAN